MQGTGEGMLDRLAPPPHGVRIGIKALLHSFETPFQFERGAVGVAHYAGTPPINGIVPLLAASNASDR